MNVLPSFKHTRGPTQQELEKIHRHPNPKIAYLQEQGFHKELQRMAEGKCPMCGHLVRTEEMNPQQLQEFKVSGVCGTCSHNFMGI